MSRTVFFQWIFEPSTGWAAQANEASSRQQQPGSQDRAVMVSPRERRVNNTAGDKARRLFACHWWIMVVRARQGKKRPVIFYARGGRTGQADRTRVAVGSMKPRV